MLTAALLRTVGSPFPAAKEVHTQSNETRRLYLCAVKNRMPFLYLEALKERTNLEGEFKNVYSAMSQRCLKTYEVILEASNVLQETDVEYAVFKTIRPYPFITVDIDILIFGGEEEYEQSLKAFTKAKYEKLGYGPNSTTFQALKMNMGIDLYKEVAVSHIVYLDKNKLNSHVVDRRVLKNREKIKTLSPIADLLAIIAHSVIKEHLYTISEYYSTLYFVKEMDENDLINFIDAAEENRLINAVKTHVGISAALHKMAYGTIPKKIVKVLDVLGTNYFEIKRLKESNFKTPHKFHVLTVVGALLEKMKEEKAKRSMVEQFKNMTRVSFAKRVFTDLINHIKRETY